MNKFLIFGALPFLLFSCEKNKTNRIPIYHIDSINYKEERNYHLLYSMDNETLLSLKEKKASFFVCIYQRSCSSNCTIFDYSLYSKANEADFLIPYIDKENYDLLPKDTFPSVHENAILFFEKGTLIQQTEITEKNVSIEEVSKIIDAYTYDSGIKIVTPIEKEEDSSLDSFSFSVEKDEKGKSYHSYLKTMKKPVLFLNTEKTEDFSLIQEKTDYSSLYLYKGNDSLTSTFFEKTGIKKEELEQSSSYLFR